MEPRRIRKADAKNFMEGDEHCRLYYKTEQLVFGTSVLEPGKKGAVDPGHKNGYEIFYAARGSVLCNFPKANKQLELSEGDIAIIPPGEPHELINDGTEEALVIWSLAPPD
jgi:quercetin dioxygenase-like cupin family protein